MEKRTNHKRHRTTARRVQTTHQNSDRAAIRDTAAMLFWALMASGQIIMRKVDGWQTLSQKPSAQLVDVAA